MKAAAPISAGKISVNLIPIFHFAFKLLIASISKGFDGIKRDEFTANSRAHESPLSWNSKAHTQKEAITKNEYELQKRKKHAWIM